MKGVRTHYILIDKPSYHTVSISQKDITGGVISSTCGHCSPLEADIHSLFVRQASLVLHLEIYENGYIQRHFHYFILIIEMSHIEMFLYLKYCFSLILNFKIQRIKLEYNIPNFIIILIFIKCEPILFLARRSKKRVLNYGCDVYFNYFNTVWLELQQEIVRQWTLFYKLYLWSHARFNVDL
jgi:hypothetical protein